MKDNPYFSAISREAGLSAELLASGVTILGKANSWQDGYYNQAFFNLSIGLERISKIIIIIDYYFDNKAFPTDRTLRQYGHKIKDLLRKVEDVSQKMRKGKKYSCIPGSDIHIGIIKTLDNFAEVTRYYNLDFISGSEKGIIYNNPIKMWWQDVGKLILDKHYKDKKRVADSRHAKFISQNLSVHVLTDNESEESISNVYDSIKHDLETKVVQKYGQLYVLQIVRFISYLIYELTVKAYREGLEEIPDMNDFFKLFYNNDNYFKSRKTWSIYKL